MIDAINTYLSCKEKDKAIKLGDEFQKECEAHIQLGFINPDGYELIRKNLYYLLYLVDVYKEGGAVAEAAKLKETVDTYVALYQGES